LIWTSKSRFTVSPKEGKKWRLITELLGKPDGRDRLAAAKNYLNVEDRLTKEEGGSSIRASHIEGGKIVRADAYYKVTRGGKTFILHVMALFGNRVLENAVVSAPSAETADAEHILDAIREQ
jgi:hypothetical protein